VALNFSLEVHPVGMAFDELGVLSWKTDSTHVDVYDIRLVVSDGFDRVTQNFSLFARAGVKILSEASINATVDGLYQYKVEIWRPDLEHILSFGLTEMPDGMTINDVGLFSWTHAV